MKAEQLGIMVDAEIMSQYKFYAAVSRGAKAIPERERLGAVIRHALRDWMESTGELRIERALGVADTEFDRLLAKCGNKPVPVACDKSRIVN